MSYFVGAEAMGADEFKGEDAGFAINGGRGWSKVVFRNHQIKCYGEVAHAMGDYVFTDATSGDEVRVEYTFGYKRNDDGNVRICLHHSSVPYTPAGPAPITIAKVYFVGAEAMKNDKFKGEDAGFAINGGKGWSKVVF